MYDRGHVPPKAQACPGAWLAALFGPLQGSPGGPSRIETFSSKIDPGQRNALFKVWVRLFMFGIAGDK